MGNTPSSQHGSPARSQQANGERPSSDPPTLAHPPSASGKQSNLRLPMPQRPPQTSPHDSNPTSPSGRSSSPRRRKSLELPDLNKLTFTPAAPVTTTATHTSHHFAPSTPAASHAQRRSDGSAPVPIIAPGGSTPAGRWRHALGGKANPLAGAHALGAMSRMEPGVPGPKSAPVTMPSASISPSPSGAAESVDGRYFPASPASPPHPRQASPRPGLPPPIMTPGRGEPFLAEAISKVPVSEGPSGTGPPLPTVDPRPPAPLTEENSQTGVEKVTSPEDEEAPKDDGLVGVPIQWTGGGTVVSVTGNFMDNWKGRIKLKRSTHDFNTVLRLAPGQYRLKFIVDDSWRCSKIIPTATDDDGTLVNWIEVEAPKTDEEMKQEWSSKTEPAPKLDDVAESEWTGVFPAPLTLYQYLEEAPTLFTQEEWDQTFQGVPHLSVVPQPPTLPRILDKVLINAEPKKQWDDQKGATPPAGIDDNSILAVPNHVVLNHLTASAIKNGTLGVGTTTRYRKKYITTMFFKPTHSDLNGDAPPGEVPFPVPRDASPLPPIQ